MRLTLPRGFRWPSLKLIFSLLLLIAAILLNLKTTMYVTANFLDGDASSELVLAEHLSQTGRLLSSDWIYSTELRVLNTQLIYAPIFRIFSDWQTVRMISALIMQALLVLSYGYLCLHAGLSLCAFFFGAAVLLLPTSVTYGRIILYHCHYMPCVIMGFLLVSFFLAAHNGMKNRQIISTTVHTLLFLTLSFLSSLAGIRQIMSTQLPLLALVTFLLLKDTAKQPFFAAAKAHIGAFLLALAGIIVYLPGYMINSTVFRELYTFSDYGGVALNLAPVSKIRDILLGYLNLFGFQNGVTLLSFFGILALIGLFVAAYFIYHAFALCCSDTADLPYPLRIFSHFFAGAMFVILCVFLLADSSWYYTLYFVPIVIWYVPLLSAQYMTLPDKLLKLHSRHLCTYMVIGLILCSTAINTLYFNGHTDKIKLRYEGLSFQNPTLVKELKNPIAVLKEHGYTHGYATFWYSNPITELTDGEIRMTNLLANGDSGTYSPYSWLTLRSSLQPQEGKTFLLLRAAENNHFIMRNHAHKGTCIYENDGYFVIYAFDSDEDLLEAISE